MKKLYVLAGALLATTSVFAQGHDLFFSAYNEGAHPSSGAGNTPPGGGLASAGNEKAIQIFNPTTSTINMGQYSIARYSNGSTIITEEEKLVRNKPAGANNMLTSSDVFVYGAVDATLLEITNVWDQQAAPYGPVVTPTVITKGGAAAFNGNDAVVLRRWTGGTAGTGFPVIIDIFGVIGHDPGSFGWVTNTVVNGQTVTIRSANQSLNRKGSVEHGVTINPNSATFDISSEWEVFSAWNSGTTAADYFGQSYANLAGHASRYDGTYGSYLPLGILEDFNKAIKVFPNPAHGDVTIQIDNKKVNSITILNALGKSIKVNPINAAQKEIKVDVSSLKPGLYFVKFVSGDDYKTTIYKELLVN